MANTIASVEPMVKAQVCEKSTAEINKMISVLIDRILFNDFDNAEQLAANKLYAATLATIVKKREGK